MLQEGWRLDHGSVMLAAARSPRLAAHLVAGGAMEALLGALSKAQVLMQRLTGCHARQLPVVGAVEVES